MDKAWRLRVLRFRDSIIEVSVAPDSMSAAVTLVAEEGLGSPLSVERVLSALSEKGVKQGLEPYSIAEAVADARAGKPVLKQVVARGRVPRAGGSVETTWLVHKATGALYSVQAGNRADFKERDTMTRVAGRRPDTQARARPSDAGEDGIDVLGRPVKAGGGAQSAAPPEHDGTIREETARMDRRVYVANVSGELVVEGLFGSGGRVSIRERLAIQGDLGPATGQREVSRPRPGLGLGARRVLAGRGRRRLR